MKVIINKGQTNEFAYEVSVCSTGSDKQKEWADKIKLNTISDICSIMSQISNVPNKKEQVIKYADMLNAKTDAKFWIDNKDNGWKDIVKSLN